jgi:GH35 family endo-1,4-beta-xylanase
MRPISNFLAPLLSVICLLTLQQPLGAADFTALLRPDWAEGASVNCNVSNGLTMTKIPSEKDTNLQVETKVRFQAYWEAGLSIKTTQPVAKGDVLWITVQARRVMATNEQREAEYVVYFQQNKAPWEKSITHQVSVGAEWTKLELPFVAKHDLASDEGALEFGLGFRPQTIEFSNLELRNYGKTTNIADLPKTRYDYGGREADAPWRKEALERIEKLRKSPFTITVLDHSGKPLAGASVQVSQERSDFQFGTCVDSSKLLKEGADGERYRKTLLDCFNTAVIENGFKWPFWMMDDPSKFCPRSETLRALDWLSQHPLELRGHNLVWPGWNYSPKSFTPPAFDGRELRRVQNEHIRDLVGATYGKMQSWDVVNESLHERDYFKHMPEEESIDEWFKIAHEADSKPQLFLNDFEILTSGDSRLVVDAMVKQANGLKSRNVPVHGLGVQGHFGQSVLPMPRIKEDLDVLATTGLPIVITEFDVNSPDEEFAADLLRDMLILCYSHPSLQGFVTWGFWEKAHWIPQAAMFRSDWSERPSANVWKDLVLTKWKTGVTGLSNEMGVVTGEGYHGTYRVEVKKGGRTEIRRFHLGAGEAFAKVVFP